MKKLALIILIFPLIVTGCNSMGQQTNQQEAETIIKDYYQAIIDEDYEKAFQQVHLYDYELHRAIDYAPGSQYDYRDGTDLSVEEAKEFYLKKIDFLKGMNYKVKSFEVGDVIEEDELPRYPIKYEVRIDGEKIELTDGSNTEYAFIYNGKLIIDGNDSYSIYRDGKMNFEIED